MDTQTRLYLKRISNLLAKRHLHVLFTFNVGYVSTGFQLLTKFDESLQVQNKR